MGDNIDSLINQIIDDAEKKIRTDLKVISSKVQDDFVKKAHEAVLLYYSQYKPNIYERTYNLQNNVINEGVFSTSLNGNMYGAWIEFSADNMYDYYDGGDRFLIVEKSFIDGIHGKKRNGEKIEYSPSPADVMQKFQDGYKTKTLDGYFRSFGYRVNK